MRKITMLVVLFIFFSTISVSHAQQKSSSDILKEGLLGAGAGAIGGAASGGKSGNLWKGALAGAGVNIVGGALLDSITGEQVGTVQNVDGMNSQNAYSSGYQEGFNNGFKQGYLQGYKEGVKEAATP